MIINFVKSSAPPPPAYVVPGFIQSHWFAENATVSGSTVVSVSDEQGTEDLIQFSTNATYEPTGWGGDSGPSIHINGHSLQANGWGPRVSGNKKSFLITAKVQILSTGVADTPWGFTAGTGNNYPVHLAPRKIYTVQTDIFRCEYSFSTSSRYVRRYGTPLIADGNRHNLVVEFSGSTHRMWVDGVEMSYDFTDYSSTYYYCNFDKFVIGGWGTTGDACELRLAEMHIYNSSVTDTIRNKLIADLQNRRGT